MKKISNYFLTTSVILFGVGLIAFSSSNINTVNKVLDQFVMEHSDRCQVLDMRTIVKNREDCKDNIRHYQRVIYVRMAERLMELIEGNNVDIGRLTRLKIDASIIANRFLRKIKKCIYFYIHFFIYIDKSIENEEYFK